VRPKQLESEEQIHGLVREWNEMRSRQSEQPHYEEFVSFLQSIQCALFFASGRNPDEDELSDDEEEIEE
jgi:hypothetical protein